MKENLTNDQKRSIGENHARSLLSLKYNEIFYIDIEKGVDVICTGFSNRQHDPTTRFQVKCGRSYMQNGIKIVAKTLAFLVSRADIDLIFFIYYADPYKDSHVPDYFLTFNDWIITHQEEVGIALEKEEGITIKISELSEIQGGNAEVLWSACHEGLNKIKGTFDSVIFRRHPHFSTYHFFRYPQQVSRSWDLALLCRNPEVLKSMRYPEQRLNELEALWDQKMSIPKHPLLQHVMNYHPISRVDPSKIRQAQGMLMRAFVAYDSGREFQLASKFNVIQVNTARVMASRYPRSVRLVLDVLRGWRKRSSVEVLVALQMASTLSRFDSVNMNDLRKAIYNIIRETDQSSITELRHFQILHHSYSVIGEINEEQSEIEQAVQIARSNTKLELNHLAEYGWGVGPQVLSYYKRASHSDTKRSEVALVYNKLMYQFMREVIKGK